MRTLRATLLPMLAPRGDLADDPENRTIISLLE
jgi:hypothetical protein